MSLLDIKLFKPPHRRHHGPPPVCVCVYMLLMSLCIGFFSEDARFDENKSDYCYFLLHSHLFLGLSHTDTLPLALSSTRSCVFSQHRLSFRTPPSLPPQSVPPSNSCACTSDPAAAPGFARLVQFLIIQQLERHFP